MKRLSALSCAIVMIACSGTVTAGNMVFWQALGNHITPQCGRNMVCGDYIPQYQNGYYRHSPAEYRQALFGNHGFSKKSRRAATKKVKYTSTTTTYHQGSISRKMDPLPPAKNGCGEWEIQSDGTYKRQCE